MEDSTYKVQKRLSDFQCGLLTAHVQQIVNIDQCEIGAQVRFSEESKYHTYDPLLKGWTINKMFGDPQSDCFAVLYECKDRQAVLAFRGHVIGTEITSKKQVLKQFFQNVEASLNNYHNLWYKATNEAYEYMRTNKTLLTFTGYGFGAWLAELAIFICHKLPDCTFVDNLKAVTFESPGIYTSIQEQKSNLVNSTPDVVPYLNIVTYLSEPNLLNITNPHIGKIYQLREEIDSLVPIEEEPSGIKKHFKRLLTIFTMKVCSLDEMLEKFDSVTGKPKAYSEMENWPAVKYDETKDGLCFKFDFAESSNVTFLGWASKVVKVTLPLFQRFVPTMKGVFKLFSGKINFEQPFDFYDGKNADFLKNHFKSHHVVKSDEPNLNESVVPGLLGTLEWYLWKLYGTNEEQIEKKFDDATKNKLKMLKEKFQMLPPDHGGLRVIKTKDKITTVEDLKDEMRCLLLIDNTNLIEYLSGVQIETPIETLILRMQNMGLDCTISNVMTTDRTINYKMIPQIEYLFNLLKMESVEEYIVSKDLTPLHLAKIIYTLNALANFTLYQQHNGKKARGIIKTAKKFAEEYMKATNCVPTPFDFKDMRDEHIEKLTSDADEEKKKDLLRMYAILVYLHGRTYIYEKKEAVTLEKAKKQFKMCHAICSKLNMFEGYLSIGRCVPMIERMEIEQQFKDEKLTREEAVRQVKDNLEKWEKHKADDNVYIEKYMPDKENKPTVKPSSDLYNRLECNEQALRGYIFLIELTTDGSELEKLVENLRPIFIEIFDSIKKNKGLTLRKKASVYNTLGSTFLSLYDKKHLDRDLKGLRKEVCGALAGSLLSKPVVGKITYKDELLFIKAIFRLAKPKRNGEPEFTAAETFDGLCKVCEKLLELNDMTALEYDEICEALSDYRDKRDEINEKLKRHV
jgi:hypothetical protein